MDSEMEFSGKIGGSVQASDKVSVYAELAGITGDLEQQLRRQAWCQVQLLIYSQN